MIGFLVDLGMTIVDNKGYDYKNALYKVYELTDMTISFKEFQIKDLTFHKYVYNLIKKTDMEYYIGDYLYALIIMSGLTTDKTIKELEVAFFDELTKYEGLLKDVLLVLNSLKDNNIKIIALSNSCISSDVLKRGLEKLGILNFFEEVISSADCGFKKPRNEIFEIGIVEMYKNNIKKEDIYFLGNDYYCDIFGSKKAGLKPIWINHNDEIDSNNICYLNIKSYTELIEKINTLN